MEKNKKQKELGKMYALRAGLSVISQNSDVYSRKEYDRKEEKDKLEYNYKYTSESQVNTDYTKSMNELKNNVQKAQQNFSNAESLYKESRLKFGICLAFGLIIVCLGVILYVLSFMFTKNRAPIMFAGLGCIVVSVLIFIFSGRLGDDYCIDKRYRKDMIQEKNETLFIYNKESKNVELLKQQNIAQVKKYIEEKKKYDILLVTTNEQQSEIKKFSQNIEIALVKEYGNLLDKRDWENLDLIIYYYETGRADSIKEALQLVDVERRNNELIKSIQYASEKICNTMRSSVKALGEVLVTGFNTLSAQLEAQGVQTISVLQQGNESFNGVITQQTLNNALLAKANVSSKEMVEQMKKLNSKMQ